MLIFVLACSLVFGLFLGMAIESFCELQKNNKSIRELSERTKEKKIIYIEQSLDGFDVRVNRLEREFKKLRSDYCSLVEMKRAVRK